MILLGTYYPSIENAIKLVINMKEISLYQVDAFTSERFRGNPAAICILDNKNDLSDEQMQCIAVEMNLAETAFISPMSGKQDNNFNLRWFTPKVEVSLCGHATLATAHILFQELKLDHNELLFHTLSGKLIVTRFENKYQMDFPIGDPKSAELSDVLLKNMGLSVDQIISTSKNEFSGEIVAIIEVKSGDIVRNISPNFSSLIKSDYDMNIGGVYVTSKSDAEEIDFISRCFFPWFGIDEDPVTGSAHTILGPYWKEKLYKNKLVAHQVSDRLGKIWIEIPVPNPNNRIYLQGNSITVLKGKLLI